MLFLWVFGDNIEDILGSWKFLLFYLLCGVAAAGGQYLINPDSRVPMIGASGAIAGVMGAYLLKFPHSRISMIGWFVIIFTFELPAWVVLLYWFGIQFLSGVGSIADVTGSAAARRSLRISAAFWPEWRSFSFSKRATLTGCAGICFGNVLPTTS